MSTTEILKEMEAKGEIPNQSVLEKELNRRKYNQIEKYFPEDGDLNRHLYVKHQRFFKQGKAKRVRAFIAANRIGKSLSGGYEDSLHLTGGYSEFDTDWKGKQFKKPIKAWICGNTSEKTRDSLQKDLVGPLDDWGSALIPKDRIIPEKNGKPGTSKSGVPRALDVVKIRHTTDGVEDGVSTLKFKSYKEGLVAFEAEEVDVIHLDEECPQDIYVSCIIRTMTTAGIVYLTMTPLFGMTPMLIDILEKQKGKVGVTTATWKDAPHLSAEVQAELLSTIPEYQRKARSEGIPALGDGNIFKTPLDKVFIDPFEIPGHYARCYALDVGWNFTAKVWGAWDRDNDIVYIYGAIKDGEKTPAEHATDIKRRGVTPGVVDPASRGRTQDEGIKLFDLYIAEGLTLDPADNAVEAGIADLYQRFQEGRLKIFNTLTDIFDEYRLYRRVKGKIHKHNDHLMDAIRYLVRSGLELAITPAEEKDIGIEERSESPEFENEFNMSIDVS